MSQVNGIFNKLQMHISMILELYNNLRSINNIINYCVIQLTLIFRL